MNTIEDTLRVFGRVCLIFVAIVASFVAYAFITTALYQRAFDSVSEGMTKKEVIARMGVPSAVHQGCSETCLSGHSKTTAIELNYTGYWELLLPDEWVFSFDTQGRLIEKAKLTSP